MPIISIIVTLVVVGFLLWAVNRFIPMAGPIKTILNAVIVIVVLLWVLSALGIIHGFWFMGPR